MNIYQFCKIYEILFYFVTRTDTHSVDGFFLQNTQKKKAFDFINLIVGSHTHFVQVFLLCLCHI